MAKGTQNHRMKEAVRKGEMYENNHTSLHSACPTVSLDGLNAYQKNKENQRKKNEEAPDSTIKSRGSPSLRSSH